MLCWGKEAVRISQRSLIVIITHPTHPLLFRTWTNSAVSHHLCLEPRRATWPCADLQHAWAHDPHCICSSTHWSPSCCKCDSAFPAPLPAPSLALPLCLWAVLGWLCCLPCISLTCAPHVTGPIGSARFLPFLQVSGCASSPSALWYELHVQKLKPALLLKLLAFCPSCCPPFFYWFIFPDQELLLPFPPRPPFGVSKACYMPGPGFTCRCWTAALRILCAGAVPAQQNNVSSTCTFTSFPWGKKRIW